MSAVGGCDAGAADLCEVDIKAVHRFQKVTAPRAREHAEQVTQPLQVEGAQLDEMHSTLRRHEVEWLHTARYGQFVHAVGPLGPRHQESAAILMAQVVARLGRVSVWLSDGWKAHLAALLQGLGQLYQCRRQGRRGPHPKPRLIPLQDLFYGQVV